MMMMRSEDTKKISKFSAIIVHKTVAELRHLTVGLRCDTQNLITEQNSLFR